MTSAADVESVDSFLAELARISTISPAVPLPSFEPGFVLARRYELKRAIGRGAHGVVWTAADALTSSDVAIKLLRTSEKTEAARVCAEVATLRRLNLPGVVHLVDDGMEQGSLFLVMPFVDGQPFPGFDTPAEWAALKGPLSALLSSLAHVHAAGMVHRDLKPANVLVDRAGHPTILDFGLVRALTFEDLLGSGMIAGTPAYLAPEQASGANIGPTADLYAVGVMAYAALAGRFPHQAPDLRLLLAAKRTRPPPLATVAPGVPREVAAAIDAMLAPRPDKRPATADDALAMLHPTSAGRAGWASARTARLEIRDPVTVEGLEQLFESQLPWTRRDAAKLLFDRAGASASGVRNEIEAWVRAGWCRQNAGASPKLFVDDETIDKLAIGFAFGMPESSLAFAQEAIELARRAAESGQLGRATALLQESLSALRHAPSAPEALVLRALGLQVEVAVAMGTPGALDHVLYELCRVDGVTSPLLGQLEALVRAALAVGAWTERALDLADALPPFEDEALERLRNGVRVLAARRVSLEREETLIERLSREASPEASAMTRAAMAQWKGRLRYRQGRFEEAARCHGEAAEAATWATERAVALGSQASALMEAFAFDEAAKIAPLAVEAAVTCRHAYGWARALWAQRMNAYRREERVSPDLEFVEAVAALRITELEALVCLSEAAFAWRLGDTATALELATRARQGWTSVGERGGGLLLASALTVACSPEAPDDAAMRDLLGGAARCNVPGIGIQVIGLVAPKLRELGVDDATISSLVDQIDRRHWGYRIDVLSVDESLQRLSCRPP